MRKLILMVVIMLGAITTQAQFKPTPQCELNYMKRRCDVLHEQYSTGMFMDLTGGVLIGGSMLVNKRAKRGFIFSGLIIIISGEMVKASAMHDLKKIGIALNGNTAELTYKF